MWHSVLQVTRFELVRSVTLSRMALWFALAAFPSLLIATLRIQSRGNVPDEAYNFITYVLVPQISCMLALLLWTTPAVGSELESQSWIYLTMRTYGREGLVLGKYLVSVIWTISFGLVSATGVSLISGVENPLRLMLVLWVLVVLSALGYAALYLLIGVAFYRRSTVIGVVYSLMIEGFIAWIPATINQVTVSYRLRSLLAAWTDLSEIQDDPDMRFLIGTESPLVNISAVLIFAAIVLTLAVAIIRKREYPVQTDD